MRVIEQSAARLILEERPWGLALFLGLFVVVFAYGTVQQIVDGKYLLALLFAAISAGCILGIAAWVKRVWLVLDRAAGTVEIRRRGWNGFNREVFPLEALNAVEVQTDSDSDGTTHRVALNLKGQPTTVPLTPYFSSGKGAARAAEAARAWLSASPGG